MQALWTDRRSRVQIGDPRHSQVTLGTDRRPSAKPDGRVRRPSGSQKAESGGPQNRQKALYRGLLATGSLLAGTGGPRSGTCGPFHGTGGLLAGQEALLPAQEALCPVRVWNGLVQYAGLKIQSGPNGLGLDWFSLSSVQWIADWTGLENWHIDTFDICVSKNQNACSTFHMQMKQTSFNVISFGQMMIMMINIIIIIDIWPKHWP